MVLTIPPPVATCSTTCARAQDDHRRGHELAQLHVLELKSGICLTWKQFLTIWGRSIWCSPKFTSPSSDPSSPRRRPSSGIRTPLPRQLHVRGHLRLMARSCACPDLVRVREKVRNRTPSRARAHPLQLTLKICSITSLWSVFAPSAACPSSSSTCCPATPGVCRAPRRGSHHPHLEAQQLLLLRVHGRRVRARLLPGYLEEKNFAIMKQRTA